VHLPDPHAIWSYYRARWEVGDRQARLQAEAGALHGQPEVQVLDDLASRADQRFLAAFLPVLASAPSRDAVAWLAAGSLEDYVNAAGSEQRAELAAAATEDDRLRLALSSVYGWTER
jgi:hypothetical protein